MDRKPSILVLHPDSKTVEMLFSALYEQYQIHTANNAVRAAEILNCYQVDLLMVGMPLPVVDGIDFFLKLNDVRDSNIPIVALVSHLEPFKPKALSVAEVLLQPFRPEAIRELVERVLERARERPDFGFATG